MNEVIGVEPSAFKDSGEFLGFIGHFGFHQGRFVGAYPSKWIQQVIRHLDTASDLDRSAAVEILKQETVSRTRTLELSAPFDAAPVTWLENAIQRQQEGTISDVIAARANAHKVKSFPLAPDYFDQFPRTDRIFSSPDGYADVAKILLTTAYEIALFDPFLSKGRDTWKIVLERFSQVASQGICEEFKIFTLDDRDSPDAVKRWANQFYQDVRKHVGVTHFVLRDIGHAEADDHPRFLVSMKGALQFDKGFESDDPPRRRVVSVVDRRLHNVLCKQFLEDSDASLPFKIVETIRLEKRMP